jgi:hypothetical protein
VAQNTLGTGKDAYPTYEMAKHKKPKKAQTTDTDAPVDPHDVLRHPASPPKANAVALVIALSLFVLWFVYLVYVAVVG